MLAGKDPTVMIPPVPVEESDGYWGSRRRFWRGGAALPALLVVASLVVVVIVVGVAQLLPSGPGKIPISHGTAVPSDSAAPASPGPSVSVGSASPSVPASASASSPVKASASGSAAPARVGAPAAPNAPGRAPAAPVVTPTGRATATVEAESASLGAGASVLTCGPCSGGKTVGNIGANSGYVDVTVSGLANGGSYPLTITYELENPTGTFYVSVNGGSPTTVPVSTARPSQSTPLTTTVQLTLSAGTDTIRFFNPTTSMAPDLDKVTI